MKSEEKSFKEELLVQLKSLAETAEALGARDVRMMIKSVLDDMSEPAGNTNAMLAIPEIEDRLNELQGRSSETRVHSDLPVSSEEMDFDDAAAQ